jgi:predicted CopG family antitoxin
MGRRKLSDTEKLNDRIIVRLTKAEKVLLKKTIGAFYEGKSMSWVMRELIKHHQKQYEKLFDRSANDEEIETKYQESLNEIKLELILNKRNK